MVSLFIRRLLILLSTAFSAQSQYSGYSLKQTGDPNSVVYNTSSTTSNATLNLTPDVFLNASVSVGEIDILVANLSAKINLDAQVLSLLKFNAGVAAQIDRVSLTIQNVSAFAQLEVRLGNLVSMIDDVLDSIDLNPVIATLGQDVGNLVNTTVSGLSGSGATQTSKNNLTARSTPPLGPSFVLTENILYSVNNYEGDTHTNRILAQNGNIVDEMLNNEGVVSSDKVVGSYATDMTPTGFDQQVTINGVVYRETEWDYAPIPGLSIVAAIFQDADGTVVATRVLAEARGGGYSTID
ncbi:hypothetical protein BT63DRAFT_429429 [Microthyrium microscopicum]|uniref:Uncharacterized protein n=1 Tax=Microthyrium microscopicum TaxID=703497 RepID=A0A6A6U0A6_9PEZI|nr:hypothetical protein BT63DRAFT_429429 [Microthyrium microscopicum]